MKVYKEITGNISSSLSKLRKEIPAFEELNTV